MISHTGQKYVTSSATCSMLCVTHCNCGLHVAALTWHAHPVFVHWALLQAVLPCICLSQPSLMQTLARTDSNTSGGCRVQRRDLNTCTSCCKERTPPLSLKTACEKEAPLGNKWPLYTYAATPTLTSVL